MVFDRINVKNHKLTYTTLSCIRTNEKLFLLALFQHEISYVDPKIHIEMNRLKTITTWIPLIHEFKNLHNFHIIIQTLNTTSLRQHYENINHDHNLQMSHMGKSMVKWLMFDILENPHFTLTTILAFKIIIKQ